MNSEQQHHGSAAASAYDFDRALEHCPNCGGGNKTPRRLGAEYNPAREMLLYASAPTGYRVRGVNGLQLVAAGAPRWAVLTRSVISSAVEADVPTASIQANYADPRTWGVKVGMEF